MAEGFSYQAVANTLDTSTVGKWKKRFLSAGFDGLETHRPGQAPSQLTPQLRARVLDATRRKPVDGSTHWSCRKLAQHLGIGKDLVHRVWREADLQPHRLERYLASDDPDFERKAADVIGLYLDPPRHAAVFCVDEKTAIQALDLRDRILPLSPGRAERHGFEYQRNGTLSFYAALNTQPARSTAKPPPVTPARTLSNSSARSWRGASRKVAAFLAVHANVQLHFIPTCSSWLNQVEPCSPGCKVT